MSGWREDALSTLRERVRSRMSEYRFLHTCGVEKTVAELARLYCPTQEPMLRAAALLHDITKEYTDEQQLSLIEGEGITLRPDERESSKIWHGITAPIVIARDYPEFAEPALLSAVRWHTTGREGMTLPEALLYLADYIEPGRRFADCVMLRERFFGAEPQSMERGVRLEHLREVLLESFSLTLNELVREGRAACLDTQRAFENLKNRSLRAF